MIFDRTEQDIQAAISIRDKLASGIEISEEEREALERGTVTINTINRIVSKQIELKQSLNEMGYWNNSLLWRELTEKDVFFHSDLENIFSNTEILKESFFTFVHTPSEITPKYHYNEFNKLEKILNDIEEMVDVVKYYYRESGTFYSGE